MRRASHRPPLGPSVATSTLGRAAALGAAAVALVAACGGGAGQGKGKTSTGARASCASDAECAVANESGCCQACQAAPFAMPTLALEQQTHRCSVVECAPPPAGVQCPRVESTDGWTARCRDGTCAAERR